MTLLRKPAWLKRNIAGFGEYKETSSLLAKESLNTVCRQARCPNIAECWAKKHASFLLLGKICTRACKFCSVDKSQSPSAPDKDEPLRIVRAVREMGLSYVVLTSVTRDDLADGGASVFARTVSLLRKADENLLIEVLVPDFNANDEAIDRVLDSRPDVFSHNIEMPSELYAKYRKTSSYEHSCYVLKRASKREGLVVKSGLMLGLGETENQLYRTFKDLVSWGVKILVLGQYLRPKGESAPVVEYVSPEKFADYREIAINCGFKGVVALPFARTSYRAKEIFDKVSANKNISKKCKNKT